MPMPPVHKFTHTPELVCTADLAWDHPRINRELALADARELGLADRLRAGELDDKALEILRLQLGDDEVAVDRWIEQIESCPWATRGDHPVWRYWLLLSRCDLSTVAPYLLEGSEPTIFVLRRLKKGQWRELQDLERRGKITDRIDTGMRNGLVKITGPGSDVGLKGLRNGRLTEDDVERLREAFGDDVVETIGQAVCLVSAELRVDEGKP